MSTLRSAMVVYGLDRPQGGIGRYTRELLAAFHRDSVYPACLLAGEMSLRPSKVVRLHRASLLPALLTLGQLEIGWASRRNQYDLVHDPTGVSPLLFVSTKRIVTVHDVIPYIYPQASSRLDRLIYRFWLPVILGKMDAIITDSRQSQNDICRYLGVERDKVVVIPCAAGQDFFPHDNAKVRQVLKQYGITAPYILYVGSIETRKNLPRLLEAYARLRKWSTSWQLVIAGASKWGAGSVYEAVERLQLTACVYFTGFVDEAELPALYTGADLFVFPSLYEGFGLPVLEAMACGTPVITSNRSSLPEVAGDAAVLVDPFEVEELTYALRSVLSDPELAQELRVQGMEQAARFSWQQTARETVNVYRKVLAYG